MTKELLTKAKEAKSAEELLAMAKENGIEMTEEESEKYFAELNPVSGELADDELDNVAGGGCYHDEKLVVTVGTVACEHFCCEHCGSGRDPVGPMHTCYVGIALRSDCCGECKHCKRIDGLWLCTNDLRNGTK